MGTVDVHGLDPQEGETAFAFCVLRFAEPMPRERVLEALRFVSLLIPDPEACIADVADELEHTIQIIALPWLPPEAGHATHAQRRLVEAASSVGVSAAWFFQTGTSLVSPDPDEVDEDDDDDDVEDDDETDDRPRLPRISRAMTLADGPGEQTKTTPISLVDVSGELGVDEDEEEEDDDDEYDDDDDDDDDDEDDDDEEDEGDDDDGVTWSQGAPPQVTETRFPVDGYPAILDELDGEDFGISFKLAGTPMLGEGTVLYGFHTLWLAPYGGRYRNAAVTYDREHHAAHLWVDRFGATCSTDELVHHLMWVVAKLDEVLPIIHARFGGASLAQKYGDSFVLGGNPVLAVHAERGDAGVEAWIAEQTEWSAEEIAKMLRELAVDIVTAGEPEDDDNLEQRMQGDDDDDDDGDDDERDEDDDDDDDGDRDDDEDDDDDEAEGNEDEDRGRQITIHAGELLRARAAAGKLDPRTAERLLPVLATAERFDHRRRAVVDILGALKYRPAVPAMIRILEDTTIRSSLDSIGKADFVAATAAALGAIGDPAAIDALAKVVAAPGMHNDKARAVAAEALASCMAAAGEPRALDDAVLAELLTTIRERNDGELNAETHFAYGRLARQLPPDRRADARRKLAESEPARDDSVAMLARQAALVLASPTSPVDVPPPDLAPLLHEVLTTLDYDHDYTVRNLRIALRVAEVVPELVEPNDLVWLTRFTEPDVRERAHALLAKRGRPLAPAPVFDRGSVRALADGKLIELIREPHVVGRAALIAEAGRRKLTRARPAIVGACNDVIDRARQGGENLMQPDTRMLEAAVPVLRVLPLDTATVALFDRMLRHSNNHLKWELLQAPPHDARLIGGMFHVLGEKWGWQEKTARAWLAKFQGRPEYEAERRRAALPVADTTEELDDEDMN